LQRDYSQIQKVDVNFNESFLEFCWARTTVIIDGIKTDAMVPFADMLNHRVPKHTSWNYSQEASGFVIESVQDIEKG
jgi:histone-lysine N-methyltransferase SETD3